jgi:hypothetical protein
LIYARSRASMLRIVALAAALASACATVALLLALALHASGSWVALPAGLAAGALALAGWLWWRSRGWTSSKLCLFQDRLLVVQWRRVTPVLWERIETATLAAGGAGRWAAGGGLQLGEVLTLVMPGRRLLAFRPSDFGLDAATCRDLILRYRDDAISRARLPEFDSALDLRGRPVQANEFRRSLR